LIRSTRDSVAGHRPRAQPEPVRVLLHRVGGEADRAGEREQHLTAVRIEIRRQEQVAARGAGLGRAAQRALPGQDRDEEIIPCFRPGTEIRLAGDAERTVRST
jgi:hypothetical protein